MCNVAIEGYYQNDDPPAPYVQGQIYLPELDLHGEVHFLVDTGADVTSLMPGDMDAIGLDFSKARVRHQEMDGVGGQARYKRTKAVLRFEDHDAFGHFQDFEIDIHLMAGKEGQVLPSLLGRDILNECESVFNAVTERVALKRLTRAA